MPNGLTSHPAPGLFLKIKYPKKFDGTALCISAIAPDLNIFVDLFLPFDFRSLTHSLLGLIIYTIPITLILSTLFCSYIGPYIAKIARRERQLYKPLKFFGLDDWNYLKNKRYDKKYFIMVFYSALIGGLTHILFDLASHGQIVMFFPLILQSPDFLLYSIVDFGPIMIGPLVIQRNLTIYQIIWFIEDIILLIGSLYLLRYIKKNNLISKWYIREKEVIEK